jgi:hypothetical protein
LPAALDRFIRLVATSKTPLEKAEIGLQNLGMSRSAQRGAVSSIQSPVAYLTAGSRCI